MALFVTYDCRYTVEKSCFYATGQGTKIDVFLSSLSFHLSMDVAQQIKKHIVQIIIFFADFMFGEQADAKHCLQMLESGITVDLQIIHDKLNFGIRMAEQVIDQILVINLGQLFPQNGFMSCIRRLTSSNRMVV